ncbi:Lrp/AsnC family transcriptional regulator [Mycobacterium yunnanensis]|uniref:Lrp/AsnC family transcriptional regulator n=1 Tax=Mycobacterium yunnanensis TaxID=368477 RepID=A0A9X3BT63_9MYCO|nr:Lrp/AsnC family transcriptional regulator [Mycobacterium yunnanensis]MCV7421339.1 Lrp/AsnC family transcriptional regulator [Mycobacterium yunnanensis]
MHLDELDRRIVGALQVDGRASWRRIAEVLEVSVSTVTRRGMALLNSGAVRVVALPTTTTTAILEITTTPQRVDAVARELATRPDTIFVYVLGAPARIVVEAHQPSGGALARAVIDELPAVDGVTAVSASPILDYYRTLSSWMPGQLSPAETAAINGSFGRQPPASMLKLGDADQQIQDILEADGRAAVTDIAAAVGQSETSIRRRLGGLIGTRIDVRAVVAPTLLGLDVSAFLWVRTTPAAVPHVAADLVASPFVRYAAMTMGEHQLVVDVAVETLEDFRRFVTEQPWTSTVESVRSSPVLAAYKRSGIRVEERSAFRR